MIKKFLYIKNMNKNILIIGNKEVENNDELNKKINEFDEVIRINRFTNIKNTTDKFDMWYVDIHYMFYKLFNPVSLNKYKNTIKYVFLNNTSLSGINYIKSLLPNSKIIKTNSSNIMLYNEDDYKKYGFDEYNQKRPTTTIIAISYFIEYFKNDNIYITGIDVTDRKFLEKNNHSAHYNSSKLEEQYLNDLIKSNKIKVLE